MRIEKLPPIPPGLFEGGAAGGGGGGTENARGLKL